MLNSQELEKIISGCAKLHRDSQKQFYTYFYGYAISICMRYVQTDDDAMEIANDGFLKIFRELSSFVARYEDVEASLKGWMKKIMVNTAIDHFRKNHKYQMNVSIEDNMYHLADYGEDSIDKMSYDELLSMIQNLSPVYRTVFNLYIIDGFKHEEISKRLKISVGTSKSNLAKAKMNIQKMILERQKNRYGQTAL
ncbi:MAG: RNA polymerase sigma factor [Chitinophagaceae bacterium]